MKKFLFVLILGAFFISCSKDEYEGPKPIETFNIDGYQLAIPGIDSHHLIKCDVDISIDWGNKSIKFTNPFREDEMIAGMHLGVWNDCFYIKAYERDGEDWIEVKNRYRDEFRFRLSNISNRTPIE